MRIEIEYNDKKYVSKDSSEDEAENVMERLYENFDDVEKFKMQLDDETWLLMGKEACSRAVFKVLA